MQIVKTISAGRWRFSVSYSKRARTDTARTRNAKTQHSTNAQKLLNKRKSGVQLTGILAANFCDSKTSMFCTLTFDKEHYPEGQNSERFDATKKQADLFLQRAKRLCARRKQELKTVYVIGGGNNIRYHIHVVVDGLTGDDIKALWDRGNADFHKVIRPNDDPDKWDWLTALGNVNPAQIAGYMMQNAADTPLGKHPWHASRNCVRCDREESYEIPDRSPIPAPDGADVLDERRDSNQFSEFQVLELIMPKCSEEKIKPVDEFLYAINSSFDLGGDSIFEVTM